MDRGLRAELARLLDDRRPAARRVGIEQEFFVRQGGTAVDFGTLIRAGRLPGVRLDRGDPHAHRLPWGGVITADGREAEVATPPAALMPGFTDRLGGWLSRARHELHASLGADFQVEGASTHLNVQVADEDAVAIARRFVARHAVAMMLLLDRRDSPGLLVRPRRGRLELGGEFATGLQLVAASVFAAAATTDCQRRARTAGGRFVVEDARERFGYYVDRRAFGRDLYDTGRATPVGRHTAQWSLGRSWERVRHHAAGFATDAELAATDAVVRGDHPLPSELPDTDHLAGTFAPWGEDLTTPRTRHSFTLLAVIATWDHVVLELCDSDRAWFVALPAERADSFVQRFAAGQLDDLVRRIAAAPDGAFAPLLAVDQIGDGDVFGSVGRDTTLQPPERMPGTGLIGGGGPGGREHKHRSDSQEPPAQPRRVRTGRSWARPAVFAGAAAVVAATLVVVQLTRGAGEETAAPPAGADVTAPAASPTSPTAPTSPTPTVVPSLVANDLAGSYTFVRTVVDGNPDNPVGTRSTFKTTLTVKCGGTGCVVTFPGLGSSPLAGGALRYAGTTQAPCPKNASVRYPLQYDTRLVPTRDASGAVSGFTGTQRLTAKAGTCPNTNVDPVATNWVGTRA